MKKSAKVILAIVAVLLVATIVFASLYLSNRQEIPEGVLAVNYRGSTVYASFDTLTLQAITGTIVNGKGEEKVIEATGIELSMLLQALHIDPTSINSVAVTADDAYSVSLTAEEIAESGKAFLAKDGDEFNLIVFGESNSKRSVRDVVKLDID